MIRCGITCVLQDSYLLKFPDHFISKYLFNPNVHSIHPCTTVVAVATGIARMCAYFAHAASRKIKVLY